MKGVKSCKTTACCLAYRHEILGLALLAIATFMTIVTWNSFGIVAMFVVGAVLCCYRHCCCHVSHGNTHCKVMEDDMVTMMSLEKELKPKKTKRVTKAKK